VPSIGIGHTDAAGPPQVRKGDVIPMARAFSIFATDMAKYEKAVDRAIKVQLSQPAFDALVSFHFNTGAIGGGTVDDRLNRGDVEGALRTIGLYVNANGKRFEGLASRRREEIAMFRTGTYPSRKIMVKDSLNASARYIAANSIPWREEATKPPTLAIDIPLAPIQIPPSPVPNLPAVIVKPKPPGFWSWLWATIGNRA
jgi:lysozyme